MALSWIGVGIVDAAAAWVWERGLSEVWVKLKMKKTPAMSPESKPMRKHEFSGRK